MITLLVALRPRAWRARYGEEFRALLEDTPLTVAVVLDVLLHAAGHHARARPATARAVGALALSVLIEIGALGQHLTDNILWPPTTLLRGLALAMLLLAWAPLVDHLVRVIRRRNRAAVGPGQ